MNTESLCELVQHNCNIADAKHAGNFTLCTYLMKMREYCRWDKGYSYTDILSKEEVGEWVTDRESLWDELDEQSFAPIEINDMRFDPFDTEAINDSLQQYGLVYSGGIGARSVPHFFLGKLDESKAFDDHQVVIASEECARDLSSPPAMTLQNIIFIRKESVRRMLWEKLQEWQWHKLENAASRAFSFYDFKNDINAALDDMTNVESQTILLHERGEIETAKQLGEAWKVFLTNLSSTRLDLLARAVKDFYADTLFMLPTLLQCNNHASIHYYAANMSALRKQLSPSFLTAYNNWYETDNAAALSKWTEESHKHWGNVCHSVLQMYLNDESEGDIERFIETKIL